MTDLLVLRTALRDALRPRRVVTALLLIALPALIGLLCRVLTPAADWRPEERYDELVVLLVFGFTLTILSVVGGTGVVSEELEQRTVVYVLTRPLPRWRLLLARFVVSFAVVAAITLLSLLLLALAVFGPTHVGSVALGPDVRALLIGAWTYCAVFLLLGALLPRPLIYGLLYVFGWEGIVTILPGSFARLSLMSYLRVIAAREIGDTPAATGDAGNNFLTNIGRAPDMAISTHQAYLILGIVSLVALCAAVAVFSTREYVPREDAE